MKKESVAGFVNESNVGCEKQGRVKKYATIFGLSNWKKRMIIC